MKRITNTLSVLLLVAGLHAGAHAAEAMSHMQHGGAAKAAVGAVLTEGLVKKVDKAAGRITLTHGPLPNGMPGMTMAFKVKDAGRLEGLREGQKVLFATDEALTIVRLEMAN